MIKQKLYNSRLEIFLWVLLFFCIPFPGYAQSVLLPSNRITIEEGFRQIEAQTSYTVAFSLAVIDISKEVLLPKLTLELPQLLSSLLQETGCRYRIGEKHIIILPPFKEEKKESSLPEVKFYPDESPFIHSGFVYDEQNQTPLSYATISLLDTNGDVLKVAVTDEKGYFHLQTSGSPWLVRISFMGYRILVEPLEEQIENPTTYLLQEDARLLEEVVVQGATTRYTVDKNVYLVTPQMREGAANAQEMLDKIHGVKFDPLSNTIRVANDEAVLLLVNGLQQSPEYIKNLSTDRIHQIEVLNEPSGRYLSEGYSAIINFILKKDFTGYDVNVRNFMIVNPVGTNGDDWLMNEQPGIGLTHTRNKVNLYGNFVYGRSRWNTLKEKSASYEEFLSFHSDSPDRKGPNDIYKYNGYYAGGGINYYISSDHTLSFQGDYTFNDIRTKETYQMNAFNSTGEWRGKQEHTTINETDDKDFVGTFFYQGKINDRFHLYSDLSYNYYDNSVYNDYFQGESSLHHETNNYDEYKHQVLFNLDGTYKLTTGTLNAGYSGVYRTYSSKSNAGDIFLDYNEFRNKFFGYYSLDPLENLKIKLGTGIEYIRATNLGDDFSQWSWQPYVQVNYKWNDHININAGYVTNVYYPSLYQLSPMTTYIDTALLQTGNPLLKSAIRHSVTLRLTFWDRLSVIPTFKFTPDRISDIYTYSNYQFYKSFENINVRQYILHVIYDQPLNRYLKFSGMGLYYYDEAKYEDIRSSFHGWLFEAGLKYYHPGLKLGINVDYSRRLEKSILLQGYQMINRDSWLVNISKQCWNDRLSLMLSYFPPIDWGVRYKQEKEIETPFYQERSVQDMKVYRNMLLFRANLRFKSGQIKRSGRQSQINREERETRTIGF